MLGLWIVCMRIQKSASDYALTGAHQHTSVPPNACVILAGLTAKSQKSCSSFWTLLSTGKQITICIDYESQEFGSSIVPAQSNLSQHSLSRVMLSQHSLSQHNLNLLSRSQHSLNLHSLSQHSLGPCSMCLDSMCHQTLCKQSMG